MKETIKIKIGKRDPLKEKSFHMAVRIVRLYKHLTEEMKEFIMSKQILRCGTNPGAARWILSINWELPKKKPQKHNSGFNSFFKQTI